VSFEPRLPRDDVNVSAIHPLAEAGWLVAAAGVLGLALAVAAFAATEVLARWLPPTAEVRLFGGLGSAFAGGDPEAADVRAPAARALLARLAAHWRENPYAFHLLVIDQPALNAFALPGGSIAVTRGLLDAAESENELAFVLGHEIGHFAGRDHLRALGRSLILSLALRSLAGFGAGPEVPALASELAGRRFDREQERRADAFALDLSAAEYGHVAGADAFFARLPDARAGLGQRAAAWLATHPVTEDRIAALHAHARAAGLAEEGPLTPLLAPGG
jgi:Zn-dependent protease with chaperone function